MLCGEARRSCEGFAGTEKEMPNGCLEWRCVSCPNELLNKTPGSSPNGMVSGVARYSNTETWVGRPISTYQSRYWNTELLQHLRQFLLPRPQKAPVVMLLNKTAKRRKQGAWRSAFLSNKLDNSSRPARPRPPRIALYVFSPNELNTPPHRALASCSPSASIRLLSIRQYNPKRRRLNHQWVCTS